jgi:putative oxidoreductase
MTLARRFESLAALTRRAARAVEPLAPLVTRVVLGHAFFLTGLGKLRNLDRTTDFFASIGLPLPGANAVLVGVLELLGGLCLVLGLGTRLFAALLAGTLAVALMTADRNAFLHALPGGQALGVAAFAFLLFLVWILAAGAGPLSADRLLARRLARGKGE